MERMKSETTAKYLERLKDMGFLFHGSSKSDIEELEPKYTYDPDTKRNTDTAVFAADNPTWSTIFGIIGGQEISWATSVTNGEVIAKIPHLERERVESGKGVVYILPREKFDDGDGAGQFKSHEPVKTVLKVPVKFTDYQELGGKIEWT